MDFDKKIIELRKQYNLTQEDLAEKLNVSRQTVSNWETAKCYPDIETLVIISNKFNVSLDVLIKENVKMIKDIDKKVRINKKLKYSIVVLLIILIIGGFTLYIKNNMIINAEAKNLELQDEIKKIVEVQKDSSLYSFQVQKVNAVDLSIDVKEIDIYIDNKIVVQKARVINYYDKNHRVVTDFNKTEYIIVEVPNDTYSNIKVAEVNNNTISLKKS